MYEHIKASLRNDSSNSALQTQIAGIFGEAGHVDYSSSKSALMYGFMRTLKNGMVLRQMTAD